MACGHIGPRTSRAVGGCRCCARLRMHSVGTPQDTPAHHARSTIGHWPRQRHASPLSRSLLASGPRRDVGAEAAQAGACGRMNPPASPQPPTLPDAEAYLRSVVDTMAEGLIVVAADRQVLYIN